MKTEVTQMTDCERKDCCDIEEDLDVKQNEKLKKLFEELGFAIAEDQEDDT